MQPARKVALPETQAILQAWTAFRQSIGITSIRTEADYAQALAMIDALLDEAGDDEDHPLADVLDYLADRVQAYEDENFHIPDAAPREVLRFLMQQHALRQDDLADCASQGRISDILNGRRAISKEIAKKLAKRFRVHADVFL